ncbi:hypothetical protein AURDEDRAFT_161152 [Auricularia subglabra TFB-10046 SS5]|nr:hypothetical protein AURDEDRAFT_161152 [Auricularia subglabra TFB-10046 SS5]
MGDALDIVYAEVLTRFTDHFGDSSVILHAETGFEATDPNNDFELPEFEIVALTLERDTWSLIQALTAARVFPRDALPTAQQKLHENPFTPLDTLVGRLVHNSNGLSELLAVRDWAEGTAPPPQSPEKRLGYWNFTRHRIVHDKRVSNSRSGNIVQEMDPDAVNRAPGMVLDPNDESYERALSQSLYAYIRAGQLDDAMTFCRDVYHPWRAAILRGSTPFSWGIFEPRDADAMDVAGASECSGNKRRKLWKDACATAARATTLNQPTRSLYAALAPQRRTLPILLAQCKTWEDHLWAHVTVLLEERLDGQMGELKGCFWLTGLDAIRKPEITDGRDDGMDVEEHVQDEAAWKAEVMRELSELSGVSVEEGAPASNIYHYSQLQVITDKIDELISQFTRHITQEQGFMNSPRGEQHRVVRFFAHYCLFRRYLLLDISPRDSHIILEAYITFLEAASETDLVALYSASLGSAAIERYASFLAALSPDVSNAERQAALKRAEEHGLDTVQVAIAVAEQVSDKAFRALPGLRVPLPRPFIRHRLSEAELLLTTAVEWLVFHEDTLPRALNQVNNVIRYFLAMGHIVAAQVALTKVPFDISSHNTVEAYGAEHMHYRWFLETWKMFEEVNQFAAEEPLGESTVKEREVRGAWIREYSNRIDLLRERTVKLLEERWLLPLKEYEPGKYPCARSNKRREELNMVRQIYIPELVIRLHAVLMNSRHLIPRNIRAALELANVVADSRHGLADEFFGSATDRNKLPDYLAAVRAAAIEGMALGNCADPFKIVI